jgi:hypothetical protein
MSLLPRWDEGVTDDLRNAGIAVLARKNDRRLHLQAREGLLQVRRDEGISGLLLPHEYGSEPVEISAVDPRAEARIAVYDHVRAVG